MQLNQELHISEIYILNIKYIYILKINEKLIVNIKSHVKVKF